MQSPGWIWGDVGLLRVSTDPGGLDLPENLDLSDVPSAETWMVEVWRRDDIRAVIAVSSPDLHHQIETILANPGGNRAAIPRTATALAAYLLRWKRRATPLGPFAGVAPLRFDGPAKLRTGSKHHLSVRPDSGWLAEVTALLHACPELLERVPVVANNAVTVRGGRLVAPGLPPHDAPADEAPAEATARATGPAMAALEAAANPIRLGTLREILADRYPSATPEQIGGVLSALVGQQFLLTALHIPMTEPDALRALCKVLRTACAEDIPQVASLVAQLYEICDTLADSPFRSVPAGLAARMTSISPGQRTPLMIDTIADCDVVLPEAVAREARDAVALLYRLSPHLGGTPPWREYQMAFRARYGTGALVPVLDLVSDSGLGLPAGFLGSGRERGPRQMSDRDDRLLALVQRATLGDGEIVLTEDIIEDLASAPLDPHRLPEHTEVAFSVRAASLKDLSAGRFTLELTGAPRPGSSMAGRHAHLLPAADLAGVRQSFAAAGPDTVTAQLSFAPRWRRSENVARTTTLAPAVIPIAEHRSPDGEEIGLADLAVTAEGPDLYLIQISTGRRVLPRVASALEAVKHTTPLARFLSEVATACYPTFGAFAFGAASALPYLPRIRYRRTIVSPARWQLRADQLPAHRADMQPWDAALGAWRAQWRVPDHVAIVDHDRVQPIDLRHRAHRQLLRSRLERSGHLELRECATPAQSAWIGRAHEVLLLLNRASAAPAPTAIRTFPPPVAATDLHLPAASTVLVLRVHAHPERFDDILTSHLPALIDAFGSDKPAWWFHRHRDLSDHRPGQHLAVFIQLLDREQFAQAASHTASWAERLQEDRLVSGLEFTAWQPPTGRYGHGTALDAALRGFVADSAAAVAQIRAVRTSGLRAQAVAAASYLDLAAALAGNAVSGRAWLLREIGQTTGRQNPELRNHALVLADGLGPLDGTPAGQAMINAWERRAKAMAEYARQLAVQRDPIGVLEPLLHVHHLRAVGAYPESERATGRLARALALRAQVRDAADR